MTRLLVRPFPPLFFQSMQDPDTDYILTFQPAANSGPSELGRTISPSLPITSICSIYPPSNTLRPRITLSCIHPLNLARIVPQDPRKSTNFRRRRPRSNMTPLLVRLSPPLLFQSMQDHHINYFTTFQPTTKPGSSALGRTVSRSLPITSPASCIAKRIPPGRMRHTLKPTLILA
jgi:hypothetical protein